MSFCTSLWKRNQSPIWRVGVCRLGVSFLLLFDFLEDLGHGVRQRVDLGWRRFPALAGGGDGGAGEAGDGEGEMAGVSFLSEDAGEGEPDRPDLVVEVSLLGGLVEDPCQRRIEEISVLAVGEAAAKGFGNGGIIACLGYVPSIMNRLANDAVPLPARARFAVGPADDGTVGGVARTVADGAMAGLGMLAVYGV